VTGDRPPADRLSAVLADAAGVSRPRRADDAADPAVPVAGTAVLLRDAPGGGGSRGVEVLLLERPDRGSFAGAWVFPGGKLEPVDREAAADEQDAARRAAARETAEEIGLDVAAEALVPLSCWDPPPGLALRIRTWFFVGIAPVGDLVPAPAEVERAAWLTPTEALERHGKGELVLYPPTWVTLQDLQAFAGASAPRAAAVVDAVRRGGPHRFETVARRGAEGPLLLWQEDAQYAGPDATGTARHRLEIGRLPWLYTRTDGRVDG
jgi:8-oxo-dGTP pyrophosphatase MutT (NUDIX family)